MANNIQDDVRKFILEINESKNNGQTLSNLTKLEKETGKLRAENEELQKVMGFLASQGKKTSDEYQRMEAKLKQNKKTVAQNNVEMKGLRKTLDLNYLSMGDLKKRAMELRSTLGSMSKAANPEEYNRLEKELKQVGGQMDKLRGKSAQTQSILAKLKGAAGGLLPAFSFVAILAGFRSLITKMTDAIDIADNFEERLDNLSALTGLEGDALNRLGRTAQETSVKITDGNVRIKQSADDIVDAYTKVGSQRPELLKNADALASVTEDAIILSEAAKSKLEPAVAGLTTTMNQFNLPADQSRRIINAMAAGSKAGAADIPYLTQAIEKSGTTMNLMNITLEENIGLIESIAPNYAKAELAGNSLDKVFLKLKEKQIGYADGTFSVNAALEELEQRYKNGETSASIFGVEHAKMGELLVQNRAEFNRYTKAVTGTNVAIEQAAKNTNNAKAIQAQARNEYHNAAIELGQNLSPAMTTLYKVAGSVANAFSRMIATSPAESIRREQFEVNNLVKSIVSVNDNQKIRNGLIQELQQKYPSFLGNINAENVTNETLLSTLDDVNKAYLERIKIAVNEEDIAENEKQMSDVWKEQRELVKDIDRQYQSLVKNKKENATLDEKIAAIAETSSAVQGYGSVTYASNAGIANLQKERLLDLTEKENALTKEYNDLLRERDTITTDETVPSPVDPPPPGGGGSPTPTNYDTALAALDAANQERTNRLIIQYETESWTDQQYKAQLLVAEMAYLETKKALQQQYGEKTLSTEAALSTKRVEAQKAINDLLAEGDKELFESIAVDSKEVDKAASETIKMADAAIAALEKSADQEEQIMQRREQTYLQFAQMIGQSFGDLMADSEATFGDYLKNTLLMALEAFHQWFIIEKAKTIISGIAGGPFKIAAAIAKVAAMEIAYQGVKAVISASMGKKDGGFTDMSAREDEVVDYVHGREFVASAPAVRNPTIRPVLDIIDMAQRNGTIRTLNLPAVLGAIGRRSGGYAAPAPVTNPSSSKSTQPSTTDPELARLLSDNLKATRQMTDAAEKLWRDGTYTQLLGRNGLLKKESEYQKMKSDVTM